MSNSAISMAYGAAIGAFVGAVVLAAVVTVNPATTPAQLFAATSTRPVSTIAPVNVRTFTQSRVAAGAQYPAQQAGYQVQQEVISQAPQSAAIFSWTWVAFAAVAGAVNGLFLWNSNRQVAMAATTGRREALMAGVAAAGMAAGPAFAAYGDAANVFGSPKAVEQTFDIKGDGWSGIMPGKYNKSKERDHEGMVARWEDNFDAVNNSYVIVRPIGKDSVTELGSVDDVRAKIVTPLLGTQAYDGASISEGGFAPGRFSAAAILSQSEEVKNGKTYYYYELLTRTADGNEGGRHQLFSVSCSNGKLYVFKQQAGDKRWFKGLERPLRTSLATFTVA